MKAALVTAWGVFCIIAVVVSVRIEGQQSVRRAAYVQFYPIDQLSQEIGPYIGKCLSRPDGLYCAQEKD